MHLLSICIPTYNRQFYLTELLDGLLPQVEALPSGCVEVCVSDNVSTDGTRAHLEGRSSPVLRFWTNETNIGGDRNFLKCVQEARGDYVWLLGDDELVPAGAVARVVAFLSQHQPGLVISTCGSNEPSTGEILDCFCARCVPIYYGSKGVEKCIPKDCFIDFRDFRNFAELERFLVDLTPEHHAAYIDAINRFMRSDALSFFSTEHYFRTLADGLGFRPVESLP